MPNRYFSSQPSVPPVPSGVKPRRMRPNAYKTSVPSAPPGELAEKARYGGDLMTRHSVTWFLQPFGPGRESLPLQQIKQSQMVLFLRHGRIFGSFFNKFLIFRLNLHNTQLSLFLKSRYIEVSER